MFPTFNVANITIDSDGQKFLDLEIQVIADGKVIKIRSTFPATTNFKNPNDKDNAEGSHQ